ncbi:hypothetical protein ACHAWF_012070 [Thalassiosira exigua]
MSAAGRRFLAPRGPPPSKSRQLVLAAVALSSSRTGVPLAESFQTNPLRERASGRVHRRTIHLPPGKSRRSQASSSGAASGEGDDPSNRSVTGPIYESGDRSVKVELFTKQGCTLCDKVKDVLESVREDQPHSLYAVDITDADKEDWFSKYKYDIPVMHVNGVYWAKHRLSTEEAVAGLGEARGGDFAERPGEPDAGRLERTEQ